MCLEMVKRLKGVNGMWVSKGDSDILKERGGENWVDLRLHFKAKTSGIVE